MRIAFMGTPNFAVPALRALHDAGHDIAAVYSQPPRPAGRGKKLSKSAVHLAAQELGLDVKTPLNFKEQYDRDIFDALKTDIAVVAAYGLILPQSILDMPRHGCLNIHGSLLPRWRGAAPVQRAIEAGDDETGVMIMQMEAGLDTGPVRSSVRTIIADKTAGELTDELSQLGADLLIETLSDLEGHPAIAQSEAGVTYAKKITKDEARIDFGRNADDVLRQIRAFNPMPGAFFEYSGMRYRIHSANKIDMQGDAASIIDDRMTIACKSGAIRPTIIQKSGKPKMNLDDFLRGNAFPSGIGLGAS